MFIGVYVCVYMYTTKTTSMMYAKSLATKNSEGLLYIYIYNQPHRDYQGYFEGSEEGDIIHKGY